MKRFIIFAIIIAVIMVTISFIVNNNSSIDDNNNQTIVTNENAPTTDLVEATEEVQEKFVIKNVKVEFKGGFTVITGKIKNNDTKTHNILVQTNFYNDRDRIAGSADVLLENVASETEKDFTMSAMGDLTANKNEVIVEFVK